LPDGGWLEIANSQSETYDWPDGSIKTFQPMVTYTGTGLRTRITLSLAAVTSSASSAATPRAVA
jgi:hypothetical protein